MNRLRVAIAAIVALGLSVVLSLGFAKERAGTTGFWGLVVGSYVAVAVAASVWAIRAKETDFLLPRWGDVTHGFLAAALLFGVSFAAIKLTVSGTPREAWISRVYEQLGDPGHLRDRFGRVCAVIFVASAAEEIVWRGFVVRMLEPVVGSRRAWLVSALLYAGAHLPTVFVLRLEDGSLNPGLVVAALALGLAMGALTRLRNGRVPPAIVAHALFDIAATMMFRLVGNSV